MEHEIFLLLQQIKEKTGKFVRVYSELDDRFFTLNDGENSDRADFKVTDIATDEKKHKTYFRFRYGSESFVGYIDGDKESDKNLAALVSMLFESGVSSEDKPVTSGSLKSIVLGEESAANIRKYVAKFKVSEKPCLVYAVFSDENKVVDVQNFLTNFRSSDSDLVVVTENGICAYIEFNEFAASETEQSAAEYARLMSESLYEEYGIKVKIGVGSTVGGIKDCAVSYRQAVSAVKMGEIFTSNTSVFTFKEFLLIKIFKDLPEYRLKEFLDALLEGDAKDIFGDEEMIATAEEFFNTNFNVSETARKMFMHRNTLMYRIEKIDKTTGLDIRKFQDAVTFKIITILYRLMESKEEL